MEVCYPVEKNIRSIYQREQIVNNWQQFFLKNINVFFNILVALRLVHQLQKMRKLSTPLFHHFLV